MRWWRRRKNDREEKLIEVALPLDAINKASAREKSIRHGHPSTLHLWWARRPLAAARAVIFAQMVDDPSEHADSLLADPAKRQAATRQLRERHEAWSERKTRYDEACSRGDGSLPDPGPEPTLEECAADIERERLFRIIEELVVWENTTNEEVLQRARNEIRRSWRQTCAENAGHPRANELFNPNSPPRFHDPFAGGGALPLEAQRLGLESYASDLNPVAVLINKAMIEIPPKFAGRPPVNPDWQAKSKHEKAAHLWHAAEGLAEDVRYYGRWMRDEAEERIGHLYPKVDVTAEMAKERQDLKQYVGKKLTVIAWLWARTVKSPNPAFAHVDVPLAVTFQLGTKPGKEAYVKPVVENGGYCFSVRMGKPKDAMGTKLARGANFECLMSRTPIAGDHIKTEGKLGRMGARLMAVVAEGERGRVYLAPSESMEAVAQRAQPEWRPDGSIVEDARAFTPTLYGLTTWGDLFTARQTVALTTFADLVQEARGKVMRDAAKAGNPEASGYADAVATYLGLALGRVSDYCSTICTWANNPQMEIVRGTFARQALPMTWDFAEANPFGHSTGSLDILIGWIEKAIRRLPANQACQVGQHDAARASAHSVPSVYSTDPPYFDNVPYADLSDFFYVWLRRALKPIYPDLFATLVVPNKDAELVATAYRHGGAAGAERFFLDGMTRAMRHLAEHAYPGFPATIYYAFKQSESDGGNGTASTGWETFLDAVIRADFAISGTWPMRTEREGRSRGIGSNALATSIVLVCRPRAADAPIATRRDFLSALKAELPSALAHLQRGNIAPVDLAQAAIGPGMAVYTRYAKVLDAQGKPLSVRDALALINQTLDDILTEQEGDFDADSRWALSWFDQSGFAEGDFGVAETLSKAKNTSVAGLEEAGILTSNRGKVRLLKPAELPADWDPATDKRLTTWEMVHQLIRVLESGGEPAAAALVAKLGSKAETARELCYRLYTLCERKKRAAEALSYNALVQSWPEITRLAQGGGKPRAAQTTMFTDEDQE